MNDIVKDISIERLQELLEEVWKPIIESVDYDFDCMSSRFNMKPHVSYDGYCAFVDGGAEYYGMITSYQVWQNDWFKSLALNGRIQQSFDDYVESLREEGKDEEEADDLAREDYDSSEAALWLKCRCSVNELEDGTWKAKFDAYLCEDSYGRDSIPWLVYMGGKSNQTIGTFDDGFKQGDFSSEEELETELAGMANRQVAYLVELRDAAPVVVAEIEDV